MGHRGKENKRLLERSEGGGDNGGIIFRGRAHGAGTQRVEGEDTGAESPASFGQCGLPDVNLLAMPPVVDFRDAH